MQIAHSPLAMLAAPMRASPGPLSAHRPPAEAAKENRALDRLEANRLVPMTAMAFEVGPRSNSITVTLSDRVSGEIVRRLVYDRNAILQAQAPAGAGHSLDVFV